jgi:hypothetical protein
MGNRFWLSQLKLLVFAVLAGFVAMLIGGFDLDRVLGGSGPVPSAANILALASGASILMLAWRPLARRVQFEGAAYLSSVGKKRNYDSDIASILWRWALHIDFEGNDLDA